MGKGRGRGIEDEKKYENLNVRVTSDIMDHWKKVYHEWMARHPDAWVQDFLEDLLRTKQLEMDSYRRVL